MDRAGELAALATACCWVVTALSFERAGKRIGSLSVNLIRLVMALVPLSLWGLATRGHLLPVDADLHTWSWLAVSGLVGFVIGDLCLFRALVLVGPRIATLVMASVPVWTGLFGFLFLGEVLAVRELAGMALTVGGIGWAVSRPRDAPEAGAEAGAPRDNPGPGAPTVLGTPRATPRLAANGLFMAFAGAFGQAGGLVLSKFGMGSYDAFAATQIRVMVAIVGFAVVLSAWGWWPQLRASLRDREAMAMTAVGAVAGPFLGVGLSLLAVQLAPTGIAATLMATTPILMLPISWLRGERVGLAGVLGAFIAVCGVTLLLT